MCMVSGESAESSISPDGKLTKEAFLQQDQEFNSEHTLKEIVTGNSCNC